jgi:hypothetical protein
LLVATVIVAIIAGAQSEPTLRDTFNDPNCAASCWLGIEPGVTTQDEVRQILAGQGITYTVAPVSFPPVGSGEQDGIYTFIPGLNLPYTDNVQGRASVAINFANSIVGLMKIPVNIPTSMVIDEYGAPYVVMQEGGLKIANR